MQKLTARAASYSICWVHRIRLLLQKLFNKLRLSRTKMVDPANHTIEYKTVFINSIDIQ